MPLAAPIGLSPLHILTLCGPERVLVFFGGGGVVRHWPPADAPNGQRVCPGPCKAAARAEKWVA